MVPLPLAIALVFLKIENQTVTIGLIEYSLPPLEQILGILVSLIKSEARN
jgi:hypothetical protein